MDKKKYFFTRRIFSLWNSLPLTLANIVLENFPLDMVCNFTEIVEIPLKPSKLLLVLMEISVDSGKLHVNPGRLATIIR